MAELAIGAGITLIGNVVAGGIEEKGRRKKEQADIEAFKAKSDAEIEGLKAVEQAERDNLAIQKEIFGAQTARQKPFVDVGTMALPDFIEAISNRGKTGLPAEQFQSGQISDFLGKNVPDIVKAKALEELEALELERNKSRLSDLVNVGVGGVGSEAGSIVNEAGTVGQSLVNIGTAKEQALQNAARARGAISLQEDIDKENQRNRLIGGLSELPGLVGTATGFTGFKGGGNEFNLYKTLPELRTSVGGGGFI